MQNILQNCPDVRNGQGIYIDQDNSKSRTRRAEDQRCLMVVVFLGDSKMRREEIRKGKMFSKIFQEVKSGQAVYNDKNYLRSRTRRPKVVVFFGVIKKREGDRFEDKRYSPKLPGSQEGSGCLYRQGLLITKLKLQDKESSLKSGGDIRRAEGRESLHRRSERLENLHNRRTEELVRRSHSSIHRRVERQRGQVEGRACLRSRDI